MEIEAELATEANYPSSDSSQEMEIETELATEDDLMWVNILREQLKGSINRIEDGAKQIITIATFSQTVYFAAISFSSARQGLANTNSQYKFLFIILLVLPLICWCISLASATLILLPKRYPRYKARLDDPDSAEKRFWVIVNYKFWHLQIAQFFLLSGFILLVVSIVLYFVLIPLPPTTPTIPATPAIYF